MSVIAEVQIKLCIDCGYLRSVFCKAPQNGVSLVDGTTKPLFATLARSECVKGCGPEARFFKAKEDVKHKRWWGF